VGSRDVIERAERRLGRPAWPEALGTVGVAVGYLLIGLGIFEIGGLFAVGSGLIVVLVGCVILFARPSEADASDEEVFARQLRDL
jgi:hypothetical protein